MTRIEEELEELGLDFYTTSDEFKEILSELRRTNRRESTAERRLFNGNKSIRRRKGKKKESLISVSTETETG